MFLQKGSYQISPKGDITRQEALEVLQWPREEILDMVSLAQRVKRENWGDTFSFCTIINAKSGLCDAGCIFCAQANPKKTQAPIYPLVSVEEMVKGAAKAREVGSSRYSVVTSGRRTTEKEIKVILQAIETIKQKFPLKLDVSLGIMPPHHLQALKDAGVERIHHNLESSERFYPKVTTKIDWKEKRSFVETAKEMGFSTCSGALFGMGESDEDRVDLAFTFKEMGVDSVPLNFLIPIPGTPLENQRDLDPIHCLRILAMFRLVLPDREIRICGGREAHLRDFQPLGAMMVNGFMVGGYLTRPGRDPSLDRQLIEDLGLDLR